MLCVYKILIVKTKQKNKNCKKNNCCWYIATKVVSFFSAVYMYFTFTKLYFLL